MPKAHSFESDKLFMDMLDNGFDLIAQMVNETFNDAEKASLEENLAQVVEEVSYLLDVKEESPIQLEFCYDFFPGGYDQLRECFVFQVEDQVLEMPRNWGPFKLVTLESGQFQELFAMEKYEDLDYFFEVIEAIISKPLKSLKCQNLNGYLRLLYEVDENQQLAQVIPFNKKQNLQAA